MYQINELFNSICGEGNLIGCAATFVRFSGCNLACPFCDTKHDSFDSYTLAQLVRAIKVLAFKNGYENTSIRPLCVLTGGEPALQVDYSLVRELKDLGFVLAIETNGTVFEPWMAMIDYVIVSPKRPLEETPALRLANTVKVLVPVIDGVEVDRIIDHVSQSRINVLWNFILQPVSVFTDSAEGYYKNCRAAVSLRKWLLGRGQVWRVIPQVNRFMGMI